MTEQQPGQTKSVELRAMLIAQDVRSMRGSLGRFLLGLGWCLLALIIWATFFTFIFDLFFSGAWIGWRGWFIIGLVVIVGVLVWRETRTLAADTIDKAGLTEEIPRTGDESVTPMHGSFLSKLAWGPPAMVAGLRGILGMRTRRQAAVFDRAVVLLFDLAAEPGRVGVNHVLHPPEDMTTFAAAVDWLDANDWIGRSTDGAALWLSTIGQKRLVEGKLMGTEGLQ
ncbi:MAG TPA: hypothetical protein VGI81_24080 [Tepidisphaeraceae bacterium]|jgi:MFS family permease